MPIVSDVSGLLNFILNLFYRFGKLILEKPRYLIITILILAFFPLEFVDMFLYIIINIFIFIFNSLILIILLLVNGIIGVINIVLQFIEDGINWIVGAIIFSINWIVSKLLQPINWILSALSLPNVPIPIIYIPNFNIGSVPSINYTGLKLPYIVINIFGSGGYLPITCLFDITGIGTPIW